MDKELMKRIVEYVRRERKFSIPILQREFGLGYRDAMDAVEELLQNKAAVFDAGVMYRCILPQEQPPVAQKEAPQRVEERRNALIEARRQEIMKRMQAAEREDEEVPSQFIKALACVIKRGSASISMLQRELQIGYNHAGRIIEWMEEMKYISPFDGTAKPRTVLITTEEFVSRYGNPDD